LTCPLMVLIRQQATQVYQFALAGSLGLGITLIDHQYAMSPLIRSYVVMCLAPKNGPLHPTSASIFSGCSLAFSLSLTARPQFLWFGASVAPAVCCALVTGRAFRSRVAPHILSDQFHMCARRDPSPATAVPWRTV
jgi:hypothetical protein